VDLGLAKALVGERVCLMGNLEPSGLLLQGTAETVREKSMQAIEQAGRGGGFILGSGCEVPPRTPIRNIQAIVETARRHTYPLGLPERGQP
jgi:uroporphyrinogen decarboxylase